MIAFDLRCPAGHVFEAWFASSAAYEEQRRGGLIACPCCGAAEVTKAVMAPNIAAKGNQRATPPAPPAELIKALARAQAAALEKSTWVGGAFPARARAMHLGEEPAAPIHGQASLAEARALVEEGVPVAPLPLPVVPPEALN